MNGRINIPTAEEKAAAFAEIADDARKALQEMLAECKTPGERACLLDLADELMDTCRLTVGELRVVERKAGGSLCLCGSRQPFETCGPNHMYPAMVDPNNPKNRGRVPL